MECADISTTVEELTKRGVVFEHFEGFGQDNLGIATFPNDDKVAWFKEPIFSI